MMKSIAAAAVSDIKEASDLLHQHLSRIQGIDLEQIIDTDQQYTACESLVHLIGWQEYVLEILPQMLAKIDNPIPPVDAEARNAQAYSERKDKLVNELLTEFDENNQQIITILQKASPEALTLRRVRNNQIFTIKSYVIDTILQNVLRYVDQLKDL